MKNFKVATIIGTRPEIIRLSAVIKLFDKKINHTLIHTGQNYDYELNEIFFDDLNIKKPKHFLNAVGKTPAETIGLVISESEKILKKVKPDAVLILGDTNSCLSAIAAKRLKIPIFHMEAGNRCFDIRVPEEINRKIVDHTADINLPYSSIAREYLLREGFPPDQIIKTGSPMKEVINQNLLNIQESNILQDLKLTQSKYFVVSCHREENLDNFDQFNNLLESLNLIAAKYKLPIIFSTHPRTKKKLKEISLTPNNLIKFLKPLSFSDYIALQINSLLVLSDSGTINEESSILKFNAINIRDCHERPEAAEETSAIMTGMNVSRIMQAIKLLSDKKLSNKFTTLVNDYDVDNVSYKVLRTIISYTDFVNTKIWRKS